MSFGDSFRNLPLDQTQDLPAAFDLKFMDQLRSKKSKGKTSAPPLAPPVLQKASESDSDSDSDSDEEEEELNDSKSYMGYVKSTIIAALLFILCSNDIVNGVIKTMGMDGFKLLFVKVFIFAILFFIISYKFS